MKILLLVLFLTSSILGDKVLKIASYNVENLFDLEKTKYRYKEYIPNTSSLWNVKHYKIKLRNIAKVIHDMDADIVALQEIGSLKALKDLRKELNKQGLYYKHYAITNTKETVIKVALLSKIPFDYAKDLSVTSSYKYRNILEVKFTLGTETLYLFNNHWKSKAGAESMRIVSAKRLRKRIEELGQEKNFILLGDFNSAYEEHIQFKRKRKHNDTEGKTGINHILQTLPAYAKHFYNLWYDVEKNDRYSYIYRSKKETLDNIIISPSLRESRGLSYMEKSMQNFSPDYLFKKKKIYRWQLSYGRIKKHKGKGYSYHLPLLASFKY